MKLDMLTLIKIDSLNDNKDSAVEDVYVIKICAKIIV